MASASHLKLLNTLYTSSVKLIGSRGHVTVDAQKRPAIVRVCHFCKTLQDRSLLVWVCCVV
jgi:hypothetical protein